MRRTTLVLSTVAVAALALAGCGDAKETSSGSGGGGGNASGDTVCATTDAKDDLLAQICDKGVLTVSTDPAYPPQSKYVPKEDKYEGFDIDVATEIAHRLGVDIGWETPSWDVITAGSWNGRWDASVGSMTPTNDRQKVLNFSQPYYYTPAVVVVNKDNTSVTDLEHRPRRQDGRRLQRLHLRPVPHQDPRHQGLHVRLRHRRRDGQGLRHRHHRAAGPRAR